MLTAWLCLAALACAGDEGLQSTSATRGLHDRFRGGAWEFEDFFGSYYLFDRGGNERVSIDYALNSARVGLMLWRPMGPGIFRGNVEMLGEVFGGPIFHGPGDVALGGTLLFRYNFVQPGARLIPYVQGGAGPVYTDIPEGAAASDAIGQEVSFNLQAIVGMRYLVNEKWSVSGELNYRHISNAGMSDPNYGIDQLGGAVGFSFSF